MFINHPHYDAILAREHVHRLCADVAAERLCGASATRRRHWIATSLRRAADHLDARPVTRKPATQC